MAHPTGTPGHLSGRAGEAVDDDPDARAILARILHAATVAPGHESPVDLEGWPLDVDGLYLDPPERPPADPIP